MCNTLFLRVQFGKHSTCILKSSSEQQASEYFTKAVPVVNEWLAFTNGSPANLIEKHGRIFKVEIELNVLVIDIYVLLVVQFIKLEEFSWTISV